MVQELQQELNKLDPALRRAVFLGWPEGTSTEKRAELMDKLMKEKFPTFRVVDFGHEYIGPYNNKKLSSVSWAEFSDNDAAKSFVKKTETDHVELQVEGVSMKIKLRRTKLQKKRNYCLHKAAELLKKSGSSGDDVKIEWKIEASKTRKVLFNGKTGFEQLQHDSMGTFTAPFTNLVID